MTTHPWIDGPPRIRWLTNPMGVVVEPRAFAVVGGGQEQVAFDDIEEASAELVRRAQAPRPAEEDSAEPDPLAKAALEVGASMMRVGRGFFNESSKQADQVKGDGLRADVAMRGFNAAANLFGAGVRSTMTGLLWELITKTLDKTMGGVSDWALRVVRAQELHALVAAASTLDGRLDWSERDALLGRIEALAEKLAEGDL